MKSLLNLFIFTFLISLASLANDLDTYVTVNRFYQVQSNEHYVEVSYFVPGSVVAYNLNENNLYQAKLQTEIIVKNKNGIVNSKTYILRSPGYKNLQTNVSNMSDVVRLVIPENDTLELAVNILDLNDTFSVYNKSIDVFVNKKETAFLSDIMLINSSEKSEKENPFTRNGMIIKPKFLNYYPTEIEEIKFYSELYQKDKLGKYLVRYLITNEEGVYVDGYASYKRVDSQPYAMVISGFNISKLPSGNYYLYMELKDSVNNIVERKRTYFQRNNKSKQTVENVNTQKGELEVITNNFARKYNLANIKHHVAALAPIANSFELATIQSFEYSENLEQMQNYFFSFWKNRNVKDPEAEWMAYAKKLQFVENNYTNLSDRGYETARGIVYLMYDKPSFEKRYNRNGQEFWLWNYENINGVGNVYFIFLNKNNISDDFRLVHTTLKNQVYDKEWAEFIKNEL